MERYNGWTNYETWSVALLIDNDQGSQEYWQNRAEEAIQEAIDSNESEIKHSASVTLADWLKEEHEENNPLTGHNDIYGQLLSGALSDVNWYEIAEHYIDDIELWVAGWNMPGYMPDCDPAVFLSFDDAKEYIIDEIKRDADMTAEEMSEPEDDESATPEHDAALLSLANEHGEFFIQVGKYVYWVQWGE